jgi:hypothetical protein
VTAIGSPFSVTSKGFQTNLSKAVILNPGWRFEATTYSYTANGGKTYTGHVYIQLATDPKQCGDQNDPCVQVTFSDGYDASDDVVDSQHHGRSFSDRSLPNLKPKDFHLASVDISPGGGQPITTLKCNKDAGNGHHCKIYIQTLGH